MNLTDWILALIESFRFKPTNPNLFIKEYLMTLSKWQLTDREWGELKEQAKLRCDFMPAISQLNDIRMELLRDRQLHELPGSPPPFDFVDEGGRLVAHKRKRTEGET